MKIKVQTKSGEFEFDCGQDEILLYAGLRHGLTLPYECATGTCGTCRARVMSGDARMDWADAPGLSYVNREKNELLMCRAKAHGDCTLRVPATVTDHMDRDVVPGYRDGKIANITKLTHDVVGFDVALDKPMTFHAGQFVVLETAELTGGRAYSMVNYRPNSGTLNFVVKRKPAGAFSDWLFTNHVDGQKLAVYGPLGRATFHPENGKNILCIAGGSGIAGMMSILACGRDASHFRDHKGYVFFGIRAERDIFYLDRLSALVEAFPTNLEVTVALSDTQVPPGLKDRFPRIQFDTGFVHTVTAKRMAGRFADVIAYVAGPPPMVDGALRMLVLEARLPGTDIRYDKFS